MMKRFLNGVFVFLIGVIILLGLAEYLARTCPNAYSIKEDYLRANANRIETLVLGSSHTYAAIQPDHLKTRAYNLANSNQTQRYDWLFLARDSASFTSLRHIIYPATSLLMNYPLEETSEWYRCIYCQLYNDLKVHSALSKYAWEVASIQTCCWKVQSLLISGESDRMCDQNGWCTFYKAQPSQKDNLTASKAEDRIRKYIDREDIHIAEEDYFDTIASFCQRHDIRIVLAGTPVSQAFQGNAEAGKYLKNIEDKARDAASRYSCIEYRDYTKDARFAEGDFFDVDHLNSTGAAKFSQIISQDFGL